MEDKEINNKINQILDSYNLEFQRLFKKLELEGNPLIMIGLKDEFVATNEYWKLIAKYKDKINKLKW